MIVDMIRNDVGRVADTGTVEVPSLFDIEVYPTVIQMTSTVQARVRSPLAETLGAIFPCASITGAPKRRSMEIIAELEEDERGTYTGAIGRISPDGTSDFSVAIRTATLNRRTGIMNYGTGSGIVWASSAEDEWEECMAKAAILRETEPFHVFESLLVEEGTAFLEKRHLARFERSCAFFGIAGKKGMLARFWDDALARLCAQNPHGSYKVKITFDGTTPLLAGFAPAGSMPSPYRVALATSHVDSADPFIGHKTNRRRHVNEALAGASGVDDVILVNTQGELTETTRGNLALEIDGKLYTPPRSSGLLPGVWRENLLETGVIEERILYPENLANAKRILMLNSVRRSVECVMA
jgi:para-aminobenzoate synthetase/4-amino-4-deoxychorismate lyase